MTAMTAFSIQAVGQQFQVIGDGPRVVATVNTMEEAIRLAGIRLGPAQTAERLGVVESTLERWRTTGTGPAYLRIDGRILYPLENILAFERERMRDSTSRHHAA